MAQLVIAAAGAAVGSIFGPEGIQVGWAVGSVIGAQFGPKENTQGPRLNDLKVTSGQYGDVIPWIMAHPRVAGQIWWASDRREISETTEQGKGGGATSTSYTYVVDLLIGLCDTEIVDVSRIWLNGKLIYVTLETADVDSIENSADNPNWDRLTVYTGASDQLPDPTYEAAVTNAPAYRGRGSVFIEGLKLGNSGVIPNLTFEIATAQGPADTSVLLHGIFTEALTDTSCNNLGNAEFATLPPGGAFGSNGYTFTQDTSSSGGLSKGFGWQSSTFVMSTAVETTIELLFEIGNSTYVLGMTDVGIYIFSVGTTVSLGTAVYSVFADPFTGLVTFGEAFVGGANASGLVRGQRCHIAICIPSAPSAGDPVRFYFNGVQAWTRPNKNQILSTVDAIALAGYVGMAPANTTTVVTYYGVRVTRGILYPNGTTFTPPTTFDYPICIPSTALDNATIEETVEALCDRAGMPSAAYDASALASITKPVRAVAIGQVTSTRVVLEQLQSAYFFEAYATDKLYFVPRAGAVVDAIDADDLATGIDQAQSESLPTLIGSNAEIPAQVAVSYMNADADYNTAAEQSDRLLTGQINTAAVQLPMAFTSTEAKGIADAMVIDGYASRVTGTLSLPIEYAELQPTNVVTVPDDEGNTYRVRMVRRTDESNILRFDWVLDDATAVESAGITSEDYTPVISVALPGSTELALLDVPLLRDDDNFLGHYVAATSHSTSWPGASIQRSLDDVEYAEAAVIAERGTLGVTTSTLATWAGGHVFDEVNTVTVDVGSTGTLSSSTRDAMLAATSVNAMQIGDEVIRFRTAAMLNQGIYTLSGLLRGQSGTEWAMGTHTSSDQVVLLTMQGLRYVSIDLPSVGAVRYYKGVTRGRALSTATSEAFTSNAVSMLPLYPVDIRGTVNAANEIVLTWNRRTRLSSAFLASTGVPLGEAAESYSVDVVLVSGSVLKRTITSTTPTVTYTAAQQTEDGISASTAIRFDVYQVSGTVGRGRAGSLSTVGAVTPSAQITRITVGGTFATGAALYATLGGVTYNYTSVGGDTNLAGIATSFAAVIDAAAAYTAAAVSADIDVTGAVSSAFPVVVGVSAGDNTATWALTQTASATVAGVSNKFTTTWLNLGDPAGSNAYPLGTNFYLIVQRISPPLNLIYTYNSTPSGRTDYTVRPIVAAGIAGAVATSGDDDAYGFIVLVDAGELWTVNTFTPAAEPYNWTVQATTSNGAISGLVGNTASGVTPATLRPQINTLTLAGTPATGRVYRATLAGVDYDYTATGGDTTMDLVATGLAGVIDAASDFIASAAGAVITIAHASNNVPFTYSASIIGSTVTLSAINTQEAA